MVTPYLKQCGPPEFSADVAAQGGRLLAGRIGKVLVAEGRQRGAQLQVEESGLHSGPQIGAVHLQDPVHPDHLEDDAALEGNGAAAEIRSPAARYEGDVVPVTGPHDAGHLVRRGDEDHRVRPPLLEIGVVLVELQIDTGVLDVRLAHNLSEFIHEWSGNHRLLSFSLPWWRVRARTAEVLWGD